MRLVGYVWDYWETCEVSVIKHQVRDVWSCEVCAIGSKSVEWNRVEQVSRSEVCASVFGD